MFIRIARKPKSELKYNELFFSKICDDFFPEKNQGKCNNYKHFFSHICTKFCTQDEDERRMYAYKLHPLKMLYVCNESMFLQVKVPNEKFSSQLIFLNGPYFHVQNSFNMPEIQCISWRIFGAWFWTSLVKVEGMNEGLYFLENILSLGYSCSPIFYFFQS